MNNQIKTRKSPRIAEYFVVIGCDDDVLPEEIDCSVHMHEFNHIRIKFDILDQYPHVERNDYKLPEGIPTFCFPNGLYLSDKIEQTSFHSFIHTSSEGSHTLGCCLTFYEPLNETQQQSFFNNICNEGDNKKKVYTPKCICLISSWLFVTSFKRFLLGIYRLSKSTTSFIPIERYICNIIDDVPAPPSGKVVITYYIGHEPLLFRRPAVNEPNVWSGLPLFPLFECLSPENICVLFALVLTERQLLFVSSQYSLLTSCAEAITSLIYPFSWPHLYVPILPYLFLGQYFY
jgi:hypothetical protein